MISRRILSAVALTAAPLLAAGAPSTASVSGHVTAAHSGRPITDATVVLASTRGGSTYRTASSSTGRFQIDGIAPGSYRLTASHPIYLDSGLGQGLYGGQSADLLLSSGQSIAADI